MTIIQHSIPQRKLASEAFIVTSPMRSFRLAPKLYPISGSTPCPRPIQGMKAKLAARKRTPLIARGITPKDAVILLANTIITEPAVDWTMDAIPTR